MTTDKKPRDVMLDEKREHLEADVLDWIRRGEMLDARTKAFSDKYGDSPRKSLEASAKFASLSWKGKRHLSKALQLIAQAIEKESRLLGIRAAVRRLCLGKGRERMTLRPIEKISGAAGGACGHCRLSWDGPRACGCGLRAIPARYAIAGSIKIPSPSCRRTSRSIGGVRSAISTSLCLAGKETTERCDRPAQRVPTSACTISESY
jgi:hypothetical protein